MQELNRVFVCLEVVINLFSWEVTLRKTLDSARCAQNNPVLSVRMHSACTELNPSNIKCRCIDLYTGKTLGISECSHECSCLDHALI